MVFRIAAAAVPLTVLLLLVLDTSRFWILSNVNAASPQSQQHQHRHGRGAPSMASTKPPRQPQRAGKWQWPQWSHFSSLKETFKKPKLPSLSSPFTHSKCTAAAAPAKHDARPGDTELSSSKQRSIALKALLLLNSAAILYTGYFIAHIWFYLGCFRSDTGGFAPFHSIHTISSLVGAIVFSAGGIVGSWTGHWIFVLMPMLLWFITLVTMMVRFLSLLSTFLWINFNVTVALDRLGQAATLEGSFLRPFSRCRQARHVSSLWTAMSDQLGQRITTRNIKHLVLWGVRGGGGGDANQRMLLPKTLSKGSSTSNNPATQSREGSLQLERKLFVALAATTIVAVTIAFSFALLSEQNATNVSGAVLAFTFLVSLEVLGYGSLATALADLCSVFY